MQPGVMIQNGQMFRSYQAIMTLHGELYCLVGGNAFHDHVTGSLEYDLNRSSRAQLLMTFNMETQVHTGCLPAQKQPLHCWRL